ncbi:MAG: hypothetical protein PHQ57_07215 [Candidatus Omnitrophica bacterium]|nr:hypothetical protein [Candidatus Omnitrophota bacterium]
MLRNFYYHNVAFKKDSQSDDAAIMGDITNRTGRDYTSVVFKILLFGISKTPIGNTLMTINGFTKGQTRIFEKPIVGVKYRDIEKITRWEICVENGY